jgi:two-component system response regulator FlrC
VRELDNALQRALVLHQGNVIHAGDLCLELGITGRGQPESAAVVSEPVQPAPVAESAFILDEAEDTGTTSLGDEVRQREFRIIIEALRRERGRRNRAAEQLGISPRTLRYKLAQMRDAGIDLDAELATA